MVPQQLLQALAAGLVAQVELPALLELPVRALREEALGPPAASPLLVLQERVAPRELEPQAPKGVALQQGEPPLEAVQVPLPAPPGAPAYLKLLHRLHDRPRTHWELP